MKKEQIHIYIIRGVHSLCNDHLNIYSSDYYIHFGPLWWLLIKQRWTLSCDPSEHTTTDVFTVDVDVDVHVDVRLSADIGSELWLVLLLMWLSTESDDAFIGRVLSASLWALLSRLIMLLLLLLVVIVVVVVMIAAVVSVVELFNTATVALTPMLLLVDDEDGLLAVVMGVVDIILLVAVLVLLLLVMVVLLVVLDRLILIPLTVVLRSPPHNHLPQDIYMILKACII